MHPSRTRATVFAIAILAACGADRGPPSAPLAPSAPHFEIRPGTRVVSGDPVGIALAGLAPASEVEIVAERPVTQSWGGKRVLYRARATFRAGADGALDLARTAPRSGSYAGADLRGLFWSMVPTSDPIAGGWSDDEVRLAAGQRRAVVARAELALPAADPRVVVTPVGAELPGAVIARLPGTERRPAIIALGGSEGGDWFARTMSPRLASRGYAVLGLPYYAPVYGGPPRDDLKELPAAFVDIPVDRLDRARDWLRRQPGVDADRIALYGVSKGAELALIAASRLGWIRAVVAIAPSDVVWEGWGLPDQAPGTRSSFAWRGEPLPFVPYNDLAGEIARARGGGRAHLRKPQDEGRAAHPEAAARARIPIERYRGAVLVAGGGDDQVWASAVMAGASARTRDAAGLPTTALVYPAAGHALSGDGWSPTTQIDAAPFAIGGTPEGTARAQAEVWRETLAFLARALSPPSAGRRGGN